MTTKNASWFLSFVMLLAGCSVGTDDSALRQNQQNLTETQSRVLGFEAPTSDWSANNGSPIAASGDVTQGSQALSVTINGYTEVASIEIPAPGSARSHATFDLKLGQTFPWGDLRLVVQVPSQGHHWRDLGSVQLAGRPAGQYQAVSFALPSDVQGALSSSAQDLRFRFILNGPSGSQFTIDNLVVSDDDTPPGESGTSGETFTLRVPSGISVQNVIMSGTTQVTIDDRSTIGEQGKSTVVSNVGPNTAEFGAGVQVFGNVVSQGDVNFLRSGSHITGSLTTEGTVLQQDNVAVNGGIITGATVSSAATEWSVEWPAGTGAAISLPPDAPNVNLAPGHYSSVEVFSRATITLSSGQYFIDSFTLEPQVEFRVEAGAGPVLIYVRDTLRLRSSIQYLSGNEGQVIFGYLGTTPGLFEEALVAGVVAPNSTIELRRPNSGNPHKGAFFGQAVHVFSDATVLHIPLDLSFLCALGDTDGDDVPDCFDSCRRDPNKTEPGVCGCGEPETDTDGDTVPDCVDECPLDADAQYRGTCGCPSDPAPEGTYCRDGVCRGLNTCDGEGTCGDPMECAPDESCTLTYFPPEKKHYWVCTGPETREEASSLCRAVDGRKLAQVDDSDLNDHLDGFVSGSAWIGASSPDGEDWYWDGLNGLPADQFWVGGPGGRPYFASFVRWPGGSPQGDNTCTALQQSGSWFQASCAESQGYVCSVDNENCLFCDAPRSPTCQYLGICEWGGELGPSDQCVSEADAFGGLSEAQVIDALAACSAACEADSTSQACQDACTGPAAPPPAGSECTEVEAGLLNASQSELRARENCGAQLIPASPQQTCSSSEDCDPDHICSNQYAGGGLGAARLCLFVDDCSLSGGQPVLCQEIEICEAKATQIITLEDLASDFTPQSFKPEERFAEPSVPSEDEPYPTDETPCAGLGQASCVGIGKQHPWCHLGSADTLPAQPTQNPTSSGDSGGGIIDFNVSPIFSITHEAQLGAFGIPDLELSAEAGLYADVEFNLGMIPSGSFTLLNALAELEVDECGVAAAGLTFTVFEQDVFSGELDDPVEAITSVAARETCQDALATFQQTADRAKKSLRDAVELVRQYRERTANDIAGQAETFTDNFPADLCRELGLTQPPRGFPDGNCPADTSLPTESPEETINRFIRYYERVVTSFGGQDGAIGLLEALDDLTDSMPSGNTYMSFWSYGASEEKMVFRAQFLIGPIPVVLEVTAYGGYNVNFGADLAFDTGAVLDTVLTSSTKNDAKSIASAKLMGSPSAGAGLGAFAGIGFGIPGFEAKIGVETTLSLAEIWFPAHAGVGIGLGATLDPREPAADIAEFAVLGQNLLPAKRYSAQLLYSAGLGGRVRNILSGDVAGKLKISVLFFSKTWRQRLLSFQGICGANVELDQVPAPNPDCDFDLIKEEGSLNAAVGGFGWGEVRMPINFPKLALLQPEAAEPGTAALDRERVDAVFFDSLCLDCIDGDNPPDDRECFRNDECCENTPVCFPTPGGDGNECITCRRWDPINFQTGPNPALGEHQSCRTDDDCCGNGVCTNDPVPVSCEFEDDCGEFSCIEPWTCQMETPPTKVCHQPPSDGGGVIR